MWERTLQDLIRGLRANSRNKQDESKFIAQAIEEIRKEIRGNDMELKAGGVLKLTYLDMMGYDMSWASFYVVEVMSSAKFHLKSMGYLAAAQSFQQDTDVLMLTTNSLKKDLTSTPADILVALNGLSNIITPDLARDLSRDLISMLNHSRARVRKRAVLVMYKVFMKYPEAKAWGVERIKERLDDSDPGVVSATINVFCELVRHDPQDYLILAPQLFHLLTTSSNNWMLIKIVKLFGTLTPHEPRLVKKLQPPLTDLIDTTPAISLLYECVHTCIIGGMLQGSAGNALAKTCVTKLAAFLDDEDQNLKYIALLALVKIVPTHPYLVAEYEDKILASIEDQDLSIRMRALDLVSAMVNRDNLQSIVQQLLSHLARPDSAHNTHPTAAQSLASAATAVQSISSPINTSLQRLPSPTESMSYRKTLATRILQISSTDLYANIVDFEWYLSVLVDLAYVSRAPVGDLIRDQLIDITVRVRQVRGFALQLMCRVLSDDTFVLDNAEGDGVSDVNTGGSGCKEVLWAAAWLCGEYAEELVDSKQALSYLLQPSTAQLNPETIAVYIMSATKIFGTWAASLAERWGDDDLPELKSVVQMAVTAIQPFTESEHVEVQERAANVRQLFSFIEADLTTYKPKPKSEMMQMGGISDENISSVFDSTDTASSEPQFPKSLFLIQPLFSVYALNPVAAEAQASVPVPEGLDLDAWIVPGARKAALEEDTEVLSAKKKKDRKGKGKEKEKDGAKVTKKKRAVQDELHETTNEAGMDEQAREKAKAERMERLKDDPYYIIDDRPKRKSQIDIDSIPVVRLDGPMLIPPEQSPHLSTPSLNSRSRAPREAYTIDRSGEMPAYNLISSPLLGENSVPEHRSGSATPNSIHKSPLPPSPFPLYHVEDEEPSVSTPDAVKVVRSKKKGSGKSKKRTVEPIYGSNHG